MFDFDQLTIGEVVFLEETTGLSIDTLGHAENQKGKVLAALLVVIKKRTGEPTFSYKDALNVPLVEASKYIEDNTATAEVAEVPLDSTEDS